MRDKSTTSASLPAVQQASSDWNGPGVEAMALPELQPGQYWRASKEQPELDSRHEIDGSWQVGLSYLVKELKIVDGRLHTAVLHPHPLTEYQHDIEMLARHFFAFFERDLEPEVSRAADMQALQSRIQQINQEIADGPPMDEVSTASERRLIDARPLAPTQGPAPASQAPGGHGMLAVSETDLQRAQKRSAALVAVSKKKAEWLQARVGAVGETAGRIALFGKEKAEAALAQVQEALQYARHLEEGIETIGLYTGKGVDLRMLCDGPLAGDDVPLSIFQRRLYMDEEFLVHLAEGGATWRDLGDFAKALGEDEALLDRIIPAERGVVCMRYRRHEMKVDFGSFETVAEAFSAGIEAQAEEAANRTTFLLVRDGRRVWQVWSEISTDNSPRLFPTMKEVDKPFVGWGYSDKDKRIDLEDIRFSDKIEESRRIQLHYRRLLILLWGLDDRENLVGLRRAGDVRKYTDLSFQRDRFVFISDDDADRLLGTGRLPFRSYVRKQNAMLRPGSRVLCLWRKLLTSDTAPGCVKVIDRGSRNGPRDDIRLWPDNETDILVARRDGDEIVVDIEASGEKRSWMYDRFENSGQTRRIKAKVSLTKYRDSAVAFLVLDAVKPEDLRFYCESRLERAGYLDYLQTFIAARKHVALEIEAEDPSRDVLVTGLAAAGLAGDERCAGVLDDAILAWRARNRGKPLPGPLDPEWNAAATAIYGFCWIALGKDIDLQPIAAELAAKDGRKPLRLVLTGNNQVVLYATPTKTEKQFSLGEHPWIARIVCRRLRKAPWLAVDSVSQALMPKALPDEKVLAEWEGHEKWAGLKDIDRIGIAGKKKILDWIHEAASKIDDVIAPSPELIASATIAIKQLTIENSQGSVRVPDVVLPFAIVRLKDEKDRERKQLRILMLRIEAGWWAWKNGGEHQIERMVREIYRSPGHAIDRLRGKPREGWSDYHVSLIEVGPVTLLAEIDKCRHGFPWIVDCSHYESLPCKDEGHEMALVDMLRDGRYQVFRLESTDIADRRKEPPAKDVLFMDETAWSKAGLFIESLERKPDPNPPRKMDIKIPEGEGPADAGAEDGASAEEGDETPAPESPEP